MKDSRLIGTWRSDGRKTVKEILARRDMPASKTEKLRSLFGKLEVRYTNSHCYSRLGDYVSKNRYTIVAKDDQSVALVVFNPVLGRHIVHIHFDSDHYWISLGSGGVREFFKRISPKLTRAPKRSSNP